jgi:hypothetical protein
MKTALTIGLLSTVMVLVAFSPVVSQGTGAPADVQSIGPGKVRFTVTNNGRWLDFSTAWGSGESLIAKGGVFVYATDSEGGPVEVANTLMGQVEAAGEVPRRCHEGAQAGCRAPSLHPDDDNDGFVDEDRLDGVDNDNDGMIDEDFAAIGDEMIVSQFTTVVEAAVRLHFHQEAYAWSLPHIDGAILLSLTVENTGDETLGDVRIGAFFDKAGAFAIAHRVLDVPVAMSDASAGRARAVVASDPARSSVALVALPVQPDARTPWITGHVAYGADMSQEVLRKLSGWAAIAELQDAPPGVFGLPFPELAVARETRVAEGARIFALAPAVESLAPGERARLNIALIAVPAMTSVEQATKTALRTYLGDGRNRYVPPPMSMTPRVLWGTYDPAEDGKGILIGFEPLGERPVSPSDVSYFSGIEKSSVDRRETERGQQELVLRGEAIDKIAARGERMVLKGRLESGEFFEAILRPADQAEVSIYAEEAERFWKTPGKLDKELLLGSPNPFRDATVISYQIPSVIKQADGMQLQSVGPYDASVKIYNVAGRLVRVLVDEQAMPGGYSIEWPAVDDNGNPVASGVYYVKLQVEQRYITKRLILLK